MINKLTLSTLTENYGASQQNGLYIVSQKTEKQDFTILTTVPEHELFQPLRIFRNSMVATVILIITISVAFYYFITKLITRPISSLKQLMNEVDLESNQELMLENKYRLDEFESLRRAFHRMNRRLKATMDEKVHFQTLQLQSYYQVLQAQINPHFLFNMIGVITILADKKDAASVSAISRKMSEFMRYTVSAANSTANLQDELNFTSNYLNLMKSRYMHRLNFQVDVSEQLYSIIIPKLTIQPIVENSIQYGLHDGLEELYIVITGTVSGNDWEISIVDNGKGFSTEVLASLQSNIDSYMEKITKHDLQEKPVLTLGGMGLVSTLVRLRITWGQQFSYTIDNHPQGGARIKLQGNLDLLEDKL